jgi:RimJ/RimL family protein N-acetyltransferase
MESGSPATSRVALRDGRAVLVAPLYPDDRHRYLTGFEKVSAESLYARFMTPVERFSESQLRYLLEVDHTDHEALLAVDEEEGDAVGVARFVRSQNSPKVAEAAVLVVDGWQGFGLGKALCRLLAERAREVGVETFEALLLVSNDAMMTLLESLGPVRTVSQDGTTIAVEVTLPESGIGEHLNGVLRAAASGDFELATPP